MLDRGQQVYVIAQENLKLATFLLNHRRICTLDWEISGVNEDKVHFMAGQKLKDEYRDQDVLQKINKSDLAGTMEAIEEYFRSYCSVMRAPLAHTVRKTRKS